MTLTIHITEELQHQLAMAAQQRGMTTSALAERILESSLGQQQAVAMGELFAAWDRDDDAQEQRETGEILIESLDADRPDQRKLFPAELKGITW